jgi:hypothetical protein
MDGWGRISRLMAVAFCLVNLVLARAFAQSGWGATPKISLSSESKRVVFDPSFVEGASTAAPQWENGYLISREIESYSQSKPNLRLYDGSGKKSLEASIWLPDADRIVLYSVTVTGDGHIVATGMAEKFGGTMTNFIALANSQGLVSNVIRTDRYGPVQACVAPDNSVWSFGASGFDAKGIHPNGGNTLRHYDFLRGEIGGFVDRSTFADRPMPESRAHIQCSSTHVGVYVSKTDQYAELGYGDSAPTLYSVATPAGFRVTHFVVVGQSEGIFGYLSNTQNKKDPSNGLYALVLDKGKRTGEWIPVEDVVGSATGAGVVSTLWGADGESLLIGRSGDTLGIAGIHWVSVTKQ